MKVLGWRCWYDTGDVYSSDEHRWRELPDDGLLVRMIYYDTGKQIQQGMDYFYEAPHHSGEPILGTGNDKAEIEQRYPGATVKRGRWAPDEYYREIVDEAMMSTWDNVE